ncbi:hypothetical protein Cal6303_0474 [Calothrix sp. PCC 6303]|nr:hypothetical protein Cal6303_0474 [Calothrix sp. PCC 6303]
MGVGSFGDNGELYFEIHLSGNNAKIPTGEPEP